MLDRGSLEPRPVGAVANCPLGEIANAKAKMIPKMDNERWIDRKVPPDAAPEFTAAIQAVSW